MPDMERKTETDAGGEYCTPDTVHSVSFGAIPKHSVPSRLCGEYGDKRRNLRDGTGDYTSLRNTAEFTNKEIYSYLRLGVSTQSAAAFKVLGYPTPESLTESAEVNALLPDALARSDREYPLRFIDECEADGVSALKCQTAIRRGITDSYLGGALSVRELVAVCSRFLSKADVILARGKEHNVLDYFYEGTIPIGIIDHGPLQLPSVLFAMRELTKDDEADFLISLQKCPETFSRFIRLVRRNERKSVTELRSVVMSHGPAALELKNPYLCRAKITEQDGTSRMAGYDMVKYMEDIASNAQGRYIRWNTSFNDDQIWFSDRSFPIHSFCRMMDAGIDSEDAAFGIFEMGLSPDAIVTAKEDGIESSLVGGIL